MLLTLQVWSLDPVSSQFPLLFQEAAETLDLWPCKVATGLPLLTSHIFTSASLLHISSVRRSPYKTLYLKIGKPDLAWAIESALQGAIHVKICIFLLVVPHSTKSRSLTFRLASGQRASNSVFQEGAHAASASRPSRLCAPARCHKCVVGVPVCGIDIATVASHALLHSGCGEIPDLRWFRHVLQQTLKGASSSEYLGKDE